MKLLRKLLIGMTLAMTFVGTGMQATPAAAQKIKDREILRYNEAYRKQLRFFIFQGFLIFNKVSDPIARVGSFDAIVLDADDNISFGYHIDVVNRKVTVTPL